jgi:hypothetical protein
LTVLICFGSNRERRHSAYWLELQERPATKAEAQRFTNHPIINVRYAGRDAGRHVHTATAWDGESYISPHFCKNVCAEQWARWFKAEVDAGTYAVVRGEPS